MLSPTNQTDTHCEANKHVGHLREGEQTGVITEHKGGKVKDDGQQVTLAQKLMLNATLWGMEANADFEHLYTVPLLQTLSMPLSLVYLTGIVAGPSAILLLPVMGWLMDKGSNPQRRKTIALMFSSSLMLGGLLCLLVANALHLEYLIHYKDDSVRSPFLHNISATLWSPTKLPFSNSSTFILRGTENEFNVEDAKAKSTSQNFSVSDVPGDDLEVPLKAGLAMLGFILIDVGFDGSNACVKTFVLSCVPRSEHTSLLTIGLIMGSAGGVSTAALGVVDFASILGFSDIEGGRLTIQTTVQAVLIVVFVIVSLFVTILSGRRQMTGISQSNDDQLTSGKNKIQTHSFQDTSFTEANTPENLEINTRPQNNGSTLSSDRLNSKFVEHPHSPLEESGMLFPTERAPFLLKKSLEISIGSKSERNITSFDHSNLKFVEHPHSSSERSEMLLFNERTPLLIKEKVAGGSLDRTYVSSISVLEGSEPRERKVLQQATNSLEENLAKDLTGDAAMDHKDHSESCCRLGFKTRLAFIAIAVYFCTGQLNMYTMATSDYIGKVIYGGDPTAPPGSASLARYQEGMSMASRGFLVYYISYLLISLVHPRLLSFLGLRVEFVLAQLLMGGSSMLLALTARLEAFFVLAIIAGFHRACFYVVPFAVVNDIAQSMALSTGQSRVGLAMSAVTASIPLGYCTLYTWLGSVEELTGNVAIPLWLCTAFGCLSTTSFLALGKV